MRTHLRKVEPDRPSGDDISKPSSPLFGVGLESLLSLAVIAVALIGIIILTFR
jgi:hypothetical protein